MSSATVDSTAMGNTGPSFTTVWRHLLWKDWKQVAQLVVGIVLIQAVIMLMLGLLELLFPNDMAGLAMTSINVALSSPTLLALASCGVLMGQERQTGSWTWSSSLPISWRQSLASKVIVWLSSSAATGVLLLCVAAIALSMNRQSLTYELFVGQTGMGSWTYVMTVVIGLQVFIYCSIATLLIKDTLMAIVIAACGLFAFHCLVAVSNLMSVTRSLNNVGNTNHESAILSAYLASFAVGSIWLAFVFRWRWGVGQHASMFMHSRSAENYLRPQRAAWRSYAGSAAQPSEFGMLLQHGVRSSFGLQAVVFCGALLMIALPMEAQLNPIVAWLASCVLGVSVFSGDQTLNRFRFFADRGVNWKKLLVSHVVPPALLATIIVIFASAAFATYANARPQEIWVFAVCIPVFTIGMFSSLVFASPIVSVTVAIVVLFGAFAFSSSALAIWQLVMPANGISIAIWFPVSTLIILVTIIRLVPRWLTRDRMDATGIYFGTVLVAGLLPCALGLSFGFLQIPRIAWQGTPLEEIKVIDWSDGPDLPELQAWNGSLVSEPTSFQQYSISPAGLAQSLAESQLFSRIAKEIHARAQDFPAWFTVETKLIEAIEKGGARPETSNPLVTATLNRMLEESAAIALMATEQRQKELALRAWRANRKLMAFCQQPALQATTMRSTIIVWEIWNTLDDDDLQFLVDTNELPDLTPETLPIEKFREVIRARGTLNRILSNSRGQAGPHLSRYSTYSIGYSDSPLQFFPPIRWAYDRQRALALSDDLAARKLSPGVLQYRQPANDAVYSNGFHDALFRDYSILIYLEESFAERLRHQKIYRQSQVLDQSPKAKD